MPKLKLASGSNGRLEVVSGKWTEHDFEQMLRDVSQEVAALPFTQAKTGSIEDIRDNRKTERSRFKEPFFPILNRLISTVS